MARPEDYEAAFRRIECLLASECGVSAGMASLLDLCAERVPDEVWSAVGEINFETDAANLQRWLERVLALWSEWDLAQCLACSAGLVWM